MNMNTNAQDRAEDSRNRESLEQLIERGRQLHTLAVQQMLIWVANICALFSVKVSAASIKRDR